MSVYYLINPGLRYLFVFWHLDKKCRLHIPVDCTIACGQGFPKVLHAGIISSLSMDSDSACLLGFLNPAGGNPTSNTLWSAVTVARSYSDTDTSFGAKYTVEYVKARSSSLHFPIRNKKFIAVWCARRQKASKLVQKKSSWQT